MDHSRKIPYLLSTSVSYKQQQHYSYIHQILYIPLEKLKSWLIRIQKSGDDSSIGPTGPTPQPRTKPDMSHTHRLLPTWWFIPRIVSGMNHQVDIFPYLQLVSPLIGITIVSCDQKLNHINPYWSRLCTYQLVTCPRYTTLS